MSFPIHDMFRAGRRVIKVRTVEPASGYDGRPPMKQLRGGEKHDVDSGCLSNSRKRYRRW